MATFVSSLRIPIGEPGEACIARGLHSAAYHCAPNPALSLNGTTPLGIWRAGMLVGLRSLRREPALGLRRLVLPVSYWRAAEFAFVWKYLTCPLGARVLDLGSPKDL